MRHKLTNHNTITFYIHDTGEVITQNYDEFLKDCKNPGLVDAIINGRFGEYKKKHRFVGDKDD